MVLVFMLAAVPVFDLCVAVLPRALRTEGETPLPFPLKPEREVFGALSAGTAYLLVAMVPLVSPLVEAVIVSE
jgi:hypothetical protein